MKIDVLPTLQTQRIWVNWKQIQRNGKTTKVPFDSQTHKPAKSNDPATWGSFQEALDAGNDGKAYNGIGVMLSPDDMLVMGDLDGCVVAGVIDAGAQWTNREDYRQRTIDAALEKVKKFYSPPKHKEPSQGERLTRLCENEAVAIFRNQYNQPHVQLHFDGNYPHDEAVPVRSQRFKQWMARRYREMVGTPPGNDGIKQAQLQMEAICSDKPRRILYNRVGHDDSGAILYDLSDAEHRVIEFTSDGWKARPYPPVFRQHRHQKPQMFPIKGRDVKQIFDFCNIAADDRCLFLTTVCSYLIPNIPHAILLLSGPPGSGKSTITRCIKDLIDPSEISYMSAPKDEQSAEPSIGQEIGQTVQGQGRG